uniref:Uncharacterized protein n=1 Tax=Chromera velia CCMP2878 TaxID=1169474 RepID=A0A0G4HSD1_9ALVE|eukprot:Cvel_30967.t1-p1 / transcript=Cvel_30967.t1 / gene=Cvel_30967 / organism=Chromera_velia_CCMP2878 / gene_product=hypothetical protein / transcript_product=hypothetical protein / location=Cvel_scaffold4517:4717-5961(-) / protein_length=415 / sequence_SO=supercontig / SO=protein_coding / is_pseudo=false
MRDRACTILRNGWWLVYSWPSKVIVLHVGLFIIRWFFLLFDRLQVCCHLIPPSPPTVNLQTSSGSDVQQVVRQIGSAQSLEEVASRWKGLVLSVERQVERDRQKEAKKKMNTHTSGCCSRRGKKRSYCEVFRLVVFLVLVACLAICASMLVPRNVTGATGSWQEMVFEGFSKLQVVLYVSLLFAFVFLCLQQFLCFCVRVWIWVLRLVKSDKEAVSKEVRKDTSIMIANTFVALFSFNSLPEFLPVDSLLTEGEMVEEVVELSEAAGEREGERLLEEDEKSGTVQFADIACVDQILRGLSGKELLTHGESLLIASSPSCGEVVDEGVDAEETVCHAMCAVYHRVSAESQRFEEEEVVRLVCCGARFHKESAKRRLTSGSGGACPCCFAPLRIVLEHFQRNPQALACREKGRLAFS